MSKLPSSKKALQAAVDELVAEFFERGGAITYCRAAYARGAY